MGRERGVRVYQFLRGPLTRLMGSEWYDELCTAARELEASGRM